MANLSGPAAALLFVALTFGGSAATVAQQPDADAWRVQVKAATDSAEAALEARRVHETLRGEFDVYVERSGRYRAVRVGDFASFPAARPLLERVRRLGYGDAWITRRTPAATLLSFPAGSAPAASRIGTGLAPEAQADGTSGTIAASRVIPAPPAEESPITWQGHHGGGDCRVTYGWVWDPERPDETLSVDIYEADTLLATVAADRFRTDLEEAGKGDGAHGFHYVLPDPPDDGRARFIEVRLAGTATPLRNSPRWLDCREGSGEPDSPVGADGRKRMRAFPVTGELRVDGRLDEAAWERATFSDDFMQKGPDRAFPPREHTEVAFLYDDEALYVGARMAGSAGHEPRALVTRRDDPGTAERLLVSLDTYLDRRTAYTFGVTAGGTRLDHHHPRDAESPRDDSFDPVWQARTTVDSTGWTAELRIPFSQLRFNGTGPQVWGVNVRRWAPSSFLNVYWVPVPAYETGWASRFGELTGLPSITGSRRLEITPYAVAGATFLEARPDEGVAAARESETRFGADLKAGLGPNLTLDATLNPDFGQVEADPAEVNLTAFETFFEERRSFFIEGSQLFEGRGPRYFYSRRIGAVPGGSGLGNVEGAPASSTILGAAKLTGRLSSGLSVGALTAVTGREDAPSPDGLDGDDLPVAPATGYAIARLQQEFGTAGSTVGAMLTGVARDLPDGSLLERTLARRAVSASGDWNLRLDDGAYEFRGHVGVSRVDGDSSAILRLQRSSARFFQRPDATHVTLDPSRGSLSGYAAGLEVEKLDGVFQWGLSGSVESPGFEINDAGILRSVDDAEASANVRYRRTGLRGAARGYSVGLFLSSGWNLEGIRTYTIPSLFTNVMWKNFWNTYLRVEVSTRALSDDLTRGGPLMGTPLGVGFATGISGNRASLTQWSVDGRYFRDEFGGWSLNADAGASVRPRSSLELGLYGGFLVSDASRQFFGSLAGGPDETFGQRYVFSFLERTDEYLQFRLKLSPDPDLALELYAEPFISSGRFHDFGELTAARSRELRYYGTDGTAVTEQEDGTLLVEDGEESFTLWNSDFHVRSFRSNAVLRWEWRRGSTLFLIWQQNRWFGEDRWDPADPGSLFTAIGDAGEHVLVAKLSYWLSLD